ncbi:hypothetical protein EG68_09623 [Paragonimus skrjabini miyazakii]|uniref:Apple domain-containing protein n=1 Tax=Paragonimus skrjabini miyazakii TaxID=59628 RepID=A0A8S9YGI1_9TREM|nr:hypothetical protein EG68_09623 [Paragonimus skrjabini miyazakii]
MKIMSEHFSGQKQKPNIKFVSVTHGYVDKNNWPQGRTDSVSHILHTVLKTNTDGTTQFKEKSYPSTILKCAFTCQADEKCKHWWYYNEEKSCRLTYDDNITDARHPDHRMKSDEASVSHSYLLDN